MTQSQINEGGQIILYKGKGKSPDVKVKLKDETVWLSQKQIAQLFNVDRTVVTKHIRNVFKDEELVEKKSSTTLPHLAEDGKKYKTKFYNLDLIISVGYRVNSKEGTKFRIWATKTLKDHLIQGFTVNQKRIRERGLLELEKTIKLIKGTITSKKLTGDEQKGLLDIITNYTDSWLLLQKFDKGIVDEPKGTKKASKIISYEESIGAIEKLKENLMKKEQATEIFGQSKNDGLKGIIGSVYQTFDGEDLYRSIEEKAAHLLYFVVKDHPFTDGNKRIGAFLFVLFLTKNSYLQNKDGEKKVNDKALVAVVLLIAQSNPKEREIMVKLIMNFIN